MQQLLMEPTDTQVLLLESHKTLKAFDPNCIEPINAPSAERIICMKTIIHRPDAGNSADTIGPKRATCLDRK